MRWVKSALAWLDDAGMYWVGGSESEGGHWAERWWAPSKLWREKWCFLGIHSWCLTGPEGTRDYWYVGFFWRGPRWHGGDDWRRFCAHCATRRGTTRYKRLPSVGYDCCPQCGITASVVLRGDHHHAAHCTWPTTRQHVQPPSRPAGGPVDG